VAVIVTALRAAGRALPASDPQVPAVT